MDRRRAGHKTGDLLNSVNPSKPSEIVGRHHKANAELATRAIEDAHAYFPGIQPNAGGAPRRNGGSRCWDHSRTQARVRRWLVVEAGKTWPEADADVCEAIDFCEYYARQMQRLRFPEQLVQMPGERDEMIYLPLGAGVVIPPWNFPLAIMAGMTVAALVAGNTVVIKPSSETPTIAAEIRRSPAGSRIPAAQLSRCAPAAEPVSAMLLVEHPQDALRFLHRLARRRPAYQ